MNNIFILFVLIFFPLWAENIPQNSTEIYVPLSIENAIYSLYFGKIEATKSPFTDEYLDEVEKIFLYDFTLNGKHSVIERTSESEKAFKQEGFNAKAWQALHVSHLIKGKIENKNLDLSIFIPQSGKTHYINEVALTGDLNRDRQIVHKLTDYIFELLFEEQGVASTQILFAKEARGDETLEWISEIWQCDYDGANAHQITFEKNFCISPQYLPSDPSKFFYVNYKQGQPKIYFSKKGLSRGKCFINLQGNQLLPAISPKGDKLAFICDVAGRADVFIQSFDPIQGPIGKPIQVYSYPNAVQASPTFSPDGKKIAFVSDKERNPQIYVIELPQAEDNRLPLAKCLTKKNKENTCPAWSPDGTKLAYSAKTNGVRQIWIYDFEKNEEIQITFGPGHKENPSWARNSKHLVFNTADPSYFELYIIEVNSKITQKITNGPEKKHYPSWR